MKSNDNIKDEFRYFLSKSVKTSRVRGQFFFSEGTIHNYLSFCDQMGKYIEKVTNGKYTSIFDITLPSEIESVASVVLDDDSFIANDKEKNVNGLMSGALMYYVCFVNARDYFTHSKDHDSSIIGTFDDTNTSMKYEDFVEVLRDLNTKFGSLSFYLFGLKYGKWLANINITKLIGDAGLTSSMSKELNKGKRIYEIIANGDFTLNWRYSTRRLTNTMAVDAKTSPSFIPYLAALRTKPFMLLAGISGTGKSRIARELAKACWEKGDDEYGKPLPKNFCMVQVKPNWHDSSELIGYITRISGTPEYVPGDFVKFIAKAWYDEEHPYFLCLDEMNLAPVEQYFAEYLSVIESRRKENGKPKNRIATDPILKPSYHRKDDGGAEPDEWYVNLVDNLLTKCPNERLSALRQQFLNEGISIPQNLFVVGTVNMDETTFSFSRKVLDRAMTIEMNEVDLHGGLEKDTENEIGYIGNSIIGDAAEGKDVYEDNQELCDQVLEYLEQVNAILKDTPFKIAYRTRNEFLMYAVNRQKLDKESQLWQSLDEMTSMKILSRIEGDSDRTKNALEGLQKLVKEQIEGHIPPTEEDKPQPKSISAAKITEMLNKLKGPGFTSYWT